MRRKSSHNISVSKDATVSQVVVGTFLSLLLVGVSIGHLITQLFISKFPVHRPVISQDFSFYKSSSQLLKGVRAASHLDN